MNVNRLMLAAGIPFASLAPCFGDPAPIIHYAPAENLEHVDVAMIDRAEHEFDLAAYVPDGFAGDAWHSRALPIAASISASISTARSLPSGALEMGGIKIGSPASCCTDATPVIHYAPGETLSKF
jgi:hypothetical protein